MMDDSAWIEKNLVRLQQHPNKYVVVDLENDRILFGADTRQELSRLYCEIPRDKRHNLLKTSTMRGGIVPSVFPGGPVTSPHLTQDEIRLFRTLTSSLSKEDRVRKGELIARISNAENNEELLLQAMPDAPRPTVDQYGEIKLYQKRAYLAHEAHYAADEHLQVDEAGEVLGYKIPEALQKQAVSLVGKYLYVKVTNNVFGPTGPIVEIVPPEPRKPANPTFVALYKKARALWDRHLEHVKKCKMCEKDINCPQRTALWNNYVAGWRVWVDGRNNCEICLDLCSDASGHYSACPETDRCVYHCPCDFSAPHRKENRSPEGECVCAHCNRTS